MPTDRRIPVTLLTGFLGSGKTTLLARELRSPALEGCAVLINEFGEMGLDHWLVEPLAEDVQLLASGCLCCAVRGDLSASLRALFMRRLRREIRALDRVVIETTGLADPAPVIHTLTKDFFLAERFRLDGVVTVLAVPGAEARLAAHEEAMRQLVLADRIVLSQCDLASGPALQALRERVRAINPVADIRESRLDLPAEGLFKGLEAFSIESKASEAGAWLAAEALAGEPRSVPDMLAWGWQVQRHDARIASHLLRFERPFVWKDFAAAIERLQADAGECVLRIKGLVAVEHEATPRLFQAVQHLRYPVEQLPAWPDEDRATRLVFIVKDLARDRIEAAFRG